MYEPYLDVIKDPVIRSSLTTFRISAHKLEIAKLEDIRICQL